MKIVDDKIYIYDMDIENLRELTPNDVEKFENVVCAYGILREEIKALLENTKLISQGKVNVNDIYKFYEDKTIRLKNSL